MRLYTNPASPFGRKVKVLAHETGLFERLELLNRDQFETDSFGCRLG